MSRSRKVRVARGPQLSQKVPEVFKNRISQLLDEFRSSNDKSYTFEESQTAFERAAVHVLCRKMGMTSKSSGRGSQRHVSVFKSKIKSNSKVIKKKEFLSNLTFSEDAKEVLRELFTHHPPDDGDVVQEVVGKRGERVDKIQAKRDDIFCKPPANKAQIAKKLESLSARIKNSQDLRQITEKRSNLPIASFRDVITSTIESHQVVLISGETGCGKTTQVPQYLLDFMWSKGECCKLVCTQPRRISAISVAERISSERGQIVGDDVGYKIRLESKGGRHSSIVFCTNGILLRVLVSKGTGRVKTEGSNKSAKDSISDITHIIVDEIHERDRYSDFSLAILRDMLPSYPNLRLILMSATLDAERYSQYFGGCPIIRVPGFTYPVKTFYLEDVLSILKLTKDINLDCTSSVQTEGPELTEDYRVALDEAISLAWSNDECDSLLDLISSEGTPKVFNYQHSSTGLTPLMVLAGKGRVGDVCMLLSLGADCCLKANDGTTAFQLAEREKQGEAAEMIKRHTENALLNTVEEQQLLDKYEATINPLFIDVVLIEQLLRNLCINSQDGGILVFLPGWDDINRTRERLLANPFFKDSSKFIIISLHSMIPSMEQKKVFRRPASGCRKIVLSTNIAETAVTIDDIVYVIDSGRMKEKSYDPYSNVSTLHSAWISKASAKQREGRAGRCQPGTCYHLYSKFRASSMLDFQVPEIKRMPIEELCLQVKLIDPNYKIEEFLRKTLDPPVFETISNAIIVLQDIGALALDEQLTELGEKLGSLPVHPLTSKMLFFAILLNCLEPALTLACASGYRDPFTLPMLLDDKKKAAAAKLELASIYGGHSDELAVIAAFECWKNAKEKGQEARFCSQYFVSPSVMTMLSGMRKQLQTELIRNGFIPEDVSSCSLNARDPGILHAILVAGLYPKIGRLLPPIKSGQSSIVETAGGDKVRVHPQSTNFNLSFEKTDGYPLVIYDEITRGDRGMNIRNCSIVGPLPLSLLAKEIVVASAEDDEDVLEDDIDEKGKEEHNKVGGQLENKIMSSPDKPVKVVIDRWLSFKSTAIDIAQIYCLRERLSAAILFKVTYPHEALQAPLEASLYAIACILSFDGLSGISVSSDKANRLAIQKSTEIGKSALETAVGCSQNGFLKSLLRQGPCQKIHCQSKPRVFKGTVNNLDEPISEASITLKASRVLSSNNIGSPSTSVCMNPNQLKGAVNQNPPVSEAPITLKASRAPVSNNDMGPSSTPVCMNPNQLKGAVNQNPPVSEAPVTINPIKAPLLSHDLGSPIASVCLKPNRKHRSWKTKSNLPMYGPYGPSPPPISSNNMGPPITPVFMNPNQLRPNRAPVSINSMGPPITPACMNPNQLKLSRAPVSSNNMGPSITPVCMNRNKLKGAVNRHPPLSKAPIRINPSRAPLLSHGLGTPVTPVCLKPNRKPRSRKLKSSLPVYGTSAYGPYGPRGASFKRQRGNGTK